ncbi:hypothetical protein VOLCADRAFT_96782 [Volvox carteri f. nagariensis]|uniref:Pherophorin domain-containing protein n=1 Tax=Volvox carteri f. nagariensis TaxID=3068 RepID=D8UB16_VOLCA|nr:uncharacterized protein VOLCADRAFT_96782 [Volvox carteri f. nagariensis]EFJ43090.1 hypothetical protein VOLCADRAFT_96782 [Volvox carteri f. nagariensis]|eukprot:XP_002955889.1 hypothetical protein VOLCADRAFT_96782 [Volvox carteri f. nagariensis]
MRARIAFLLAVALQLQSHLLWRTGARKESPPPLEELWPPEDVFPPPPPKRQRGAKVKRRTITLLRESGNPPTAADATAASASASASTPTSSAPSAGTTRASGRATASVRIPRPPSAKSPSQRPPNSPPRPPPPQRPAPSPPSPAPRFPSPGPPPPSPPEDLLVFSRKFAHVTRTADGPFPCAWVTVDGADFRARRFVFPPTWDPVVVDIPGFVYTVEAAGMERTLPVAVCTSPEPCASLQAVESSAGLSTLELLLPPTQNTPTSPSSASSSNKNRLQLQSAIYPHGIFVLAPSDGSYNSYSVEVCTRVPKAVAAACPLSFGVMSILRPADAMPTEADPYGPYGAVLPQTTWSNPLAQLAAARAAAEESIPAVITSGCAPPPGLDEKNKAVVFSWGWDFSSLPPSLAATGFVAVYGDYPVRQMWSGSYRLQYGGPAGVRFGVILQLGVEDDGSDVGTRTRTEAAAVREFVGTADVPTDEGRLPDSPHPDLACCMWHKSAHGVAFCFRRDSEKRWLSKV